MLVFVECEDYNTIKIGGLLVGSPSISLLVDLA